jgi:metal-responsive CopG/Arc/MetJ family transcriptional regulator
VQTIQMTLDEGLVREVDRVVKELRMTRSSFARMAFREAIAHHRTLQLEKRHREGYAKRPPTQEEFGGWVAEQSWGES